VDRLRVVLIGAAGRLGSDLARTFDLDGELVALKRQDLDLLDPARVGTLLTELRPTHVVNTAAYNRVDQAEEDRDAAFALNARAVGDLAAVCQRLGATLVHFSTDYVFDGRRATPYLESDAPNPLSVYAESKLAGERLALERCERARVFRVCGLYGVARSSGKGGTNFVETMLRLAAEGRPIRVVADQVLGPSYTLDLARKVWQVLPLAVHPIYHLTNAGATSWHGFARRVFELAGLTPDLRPVTAAEFGARARRPAYSVLGHGNLTALGADDLRPWEAALAAYVAERASSR
jgi:dTDP-4-dehydrorhamnose reductase